MVIGPGEATREARAESQVLGQPLLTLLCADAFIEELVLRQVGVLTYEAVAVDDLFWRNFRRSPDSKAKPEGGSRAQRPIAARGEAAREQEQALSRRAPPSETCLLKRSQPEPNPPSSSRSGGACRATGGTAGRRSSEQSRFARRRCRSRALARVFLMSPPPPTVGGSWAGPTTDRSGTRQVSPRRAFEEWLALADAIDRDGSGGQRGAPAEGPGPAVGLDVHRQRGLAGDHRSVQGRQPERRPSQGRTTLSARVRSRGCLGFRGRERAAAVGGAGRHVHPLGSPGAVILSYGVRSVFESLAEVRGAPASRGPGPGGPIEGAVLPRRHLHGRHRDRGQDGPGWSFREPSRPGTSSTSRFASFVEREAEVLEIGEADALGYACNSLSLGRTPAGARRAQRRAHRRRLAAGASSCIP